MAAKSSKSWQRNRGQALQRTGGQALETMAEIMARRGRKSWPGNHGPEIMAEIMGGGNHGGNHGRAPFPDGNHGHGEIMARRRFWPFLGSIGSLGNCEITEIMAGNHGQGAGNHGQAPFLGKMGNVG